MPHRVIDRIRQTILFSEYDMTVHAIEEMAEDDLDIFDIEEAILNGKDRQTGQTGSPRNEIHDSGLGVGW